MSSLGTGVNLDAAAIPLRLTYYDDTVADAQTDPFNFYRYDIHKLWSCMGRAGANAVVRAGLIEEGDPFNGWAPGTIESVVAGVPLAVQYWNTNVAYNPVGGIAVGDYTLYGALAPFDEIMQHLGAIPNAAPAYNTEYWNGAAWVTVGALIKTPDYLQGGGFTNQRIQWTRPNNWVATNAATLGLALANPGTYYYIRQFLTAPLVAGPTANVTYRDWLQGHIKHFYCHYGLKRGDDAFGSAPTSWDHPGDFVLRFRDGFSLEGRVQTSGDKVAWGAEYGTEGHRESVGAGWAIISSGKGPTIFGATMAGGMLMTKPRHSAHDCAYAIRSSNPPTRLVGVLLMGHGSPAGNIMGGAGSSAIERIVNSRSTIHPAFDAAASPMPILQNYAIGSSPNALVDRFVVDVRDASVVQYVLRSTLVGSTVLDGLQLTGDDTVQAQLWLSGGGPFHLVEHEWGGSDKKVDRIGDTTEWRRLPVYVSQYGTNSPIQNIPVRVKKTDGTVIYDLLTTADGFIHGSSVFASGIRGEALFPASEWNTPSDPTLETENDAPFVVEANPPNHANFNPSYESEEVRASFPRKTLFNMVTSTWEVVPWQRIDGFITFALRPIEVPPPLPPPVSEGGYTHRPVGDTEYTHRP